MLPHVNGQSKPIEVAKEANNLPRIKKQWEGSTTSHV